MNIRVAVGALFVAAVAATSASAQVDVGVTPSLLISVQPIDDSYVGGPYLSEGIGGAGIGFGAGVNVIAPNGFVAAAEWSTARFEQEQSGRLVVGGGFPHESVPHTTRLHDSLLSGLVGYAWSAGQTRVVILGGAGARLDEPTIDGESREPFEVGKERLPFVPTGGIDVLQSLNSRAAFVVGARYAYVDRPENHEYLGIGGHILRVAAGVRVRLH
jgi:hypothetical protein